MREKGGEKRRRPHVCMMRYHVALPETADGPLCLQVVPLYWESASVAQSMNWIAPAITKYIPWKTCGALRERGETER